MTIYGIINLHGPTLGWAAERVTICYDHGGRSVVNTL